MSETTTPSPMASAELPIDGGTVHQRRKAPRAAPEAIAHGGEAQRHVQVLSHPGDVERPQVLGGIHDT